MQLTYVALALSAMCLTVSGQSCTAHEDCAADQYCDQFSTCYGCMPGGCWEYLDPFDGSGTCPDKCKDTTLSCQAHYECGEGDYCNDGFECSECANCWAENDGVYAWDCTVKCGPAPEGGTTVIPDVTDGCTAHDGCGQDEYCDNFNTCYGCQGCFEYNDPIDGSCPDHCRDSSLECQNYLDCGDKEFCTDSNTCSHCINCKEGVMGPFWPCTDACAGVYDTSSSSSTSTSTSTSKESEETMPSTAAPSQSPSSTADEKEATTELETTTDTNTSPKSSTSQPLTTAAEEKETTAEPTTAESTSTTTTTQSTTEETTAEPTTAELTTETTTESTTTTTTSTMASTTESTTASEDSSGESSGDSTMMATVEETTESSSSSSAAPATCVDDNCFRCDADLQTCEICKNGKFLLEGVCVDACPSEGYTVAGKGLFRKRCEPTAACQKGVDDCHTCDESSSVCLLCANGMHLLDGECVATCPYTHLFRGQGNFGRRCQPRSGTCTDRKDECFECASESECSFCKNGYGLYQGVCVPECPEGYVKAGRGNFRRTCVPTEM